jgi:cysteine desulfurase
MKMIYADNAATTQLDHIAFEAMTPYLLDEYGNASQPYAFSRRPKKALAEARAIIAECLNAQPEEIFFTSGGTESDNWVIKGSAFLDAQKRATITTSFEHHAVLHSCSTIERLGFPVTYIPPTSDGYILPTVLKETITNSTRLVSIMYANNEIGTIQPILELCEIAHLHGALFHTDAVQAIGHIKIDVHELGIDLMSASAHKFYGPKGIGFLYIRNGTEIGSYLDGGAQENSLRAGTENIAAITGMAAALMENCKSIDAHTYHISRLEHILLNALKEEHISFIRNGGSNSLPGLMSFSFAGYDGEAILHRMDLAGISISTGSACNGNSTAISHVLRAIGLNEDLAKGTIRISLGKNNTEDDIKHILRVLTKILRK